MRGNLYTICTDPNHATAEANTYALDELIGFEFDWYEKIENTDYDIDEFLNYLKAFGFEIVSDNSFRVTKTGKENYFAEQYQEFQELSKYMSLEKFSNSDLNRLQNSIEDTYSDAVWYGYFRTLDRFIRESKIEQEYYVTEVYKIH